MSDQADRSTPDTGDPAARTSEDPPVAEMTTESVVEALLFSTNEPLSAGRIAQLLGVGDAADVKGYVSTLNERFESRGASFRIEPIAKGYQMLTLPAYHPWVNKLHKARAESRLSTAALETLAVIAYKQPALRATIEAVRGVAVGDLLVRLREMNLIRIVGRAEEIGRPLLYGTTGKFLEVFGLDTLKQLPQLDPQRPENIPALKIASSTEGSEDQAEAAPQPDVVHPSGDTPPDASQPSVRPQNPV